MNMTSLQPPQKCAIANQCQQTNKNGCLKMIAVHMINGNKFNNSNSVDDETCVKEAALNRIESN